MKKRMHYDLIIAWANGAVIQSRLFPHYPWGVDSEPRWKESWEYRVKQDVNEDLVKELNDEKDEITNELLELNKRAQAIDEQLDNELRSLK